MTQGVSLFAYSSRFTAHRHEAIQDVCQSRGGHRWMSSSIKRGTMHYLVCARCLRSVGLDIKARIDECEIEQCCVRQRNEPKDHLRIPIRPKNVFIHDGEEVPFELDVMHFIRVGTEDEDVDYWFRIE